MRAGQGTLLGAADSTDDAGTQGLQPLAGDQTDAAGSGMEQHGLAFLDRIELTDQVVHRQALQHHGRGHAVVDSLRQPHQACSRHDPCRGIGTDRPGAVGDLVADGQVVHARPDGLNRTGGFKADARRRG